MSESAHEERAGRVTRLLRVDLPVADLTRAAAFYHEGLGFHAGAKGADLSDAGGSILEGARHWLTMQLGQQEIRLVAYKASGRPYPVGGASSDLRFQHIAIVTSDMARAFAQVSVQPGFTAISHGGPQLLPANTGSVTAFKFRDPDGHPLELIHFPQGSEGSAAWRSAGEGPFLGYDHSAISVSNMERSLRFYVDLLGLRRSHHSLNHGAAQARLDGLADPVVDVTALTPSAQTTPHVELLCYHVTRETSAAQRQAVPDIASSQLVLEADDLAQVAARLRQAGLPFASPQAQLSEAAFTRILLRDPDGHLITIEQLPQPPVAKPG
jgi:catechol 2,3-dioxygenase-like lactoylglutathione lyase family enzyme